VVVVSFGIRSNLTFVEDEDELFPPPHAHKTSENINKDIFFIRVFLGPKSCDLCLKKGENIGSGPLK
jgi:hypothetical protein